MARTLYGPDWPRRQFIPWPVNPLISRIGYRCCGMTFWLLLTGMLFFLALLAEAANFVAPDLFSGMTREPALKEEIGRLHHDLTQADKKLETGKASANKAASDIEQLRQEAIRVERELHQRKTVPPVLVYRIAAPSPTLLRYRATVSKTLPDSADPHQVLIWKAPAIVETWATSPRDAALQAEHHFRPELGYIVGAFARRDDLG